MPVASPWVTEHVIGSHRAAGWCDGRWLEDDIDVCSGRALRSQLAAGHIRADRPIGGIPSVPRPSLPTRPQLSAVFNTPAVPPVLRTASWSRLRLRRPTPLPRLLTSHFPVKIIPRSRAAGTLCCLQRTSFQADDHVHLCSRLLFYSRASSRMPSPPAIECTHAPWPFVPPIMLRPIRSTSASALAPCSQQTLHFHPLVVN